MPVDRDNERRGVPAAADGRRDDGQVDRRLHHPSALSLAARTLLHSVPRLGTDRLRRTARPVSCRSLAVWRSGGVVRRMNEVTVRWDG